MGASSSLLLLDWQTPSLAAEIRQRQQRRNQADEKNLWRGSPELRDGRNAK
jgi:hypothetical protein